jgi:hypothetical protein
LDRTKSSRRSVNVEQAGSRSVTVLTNWLALKKQ